MTEQSPKIFINPACYTLKKSGVKDVSYTRTTFEDKDAVIFSLGNTFKPEDNFFYAWVTHVDNEERYSVDLSNVPNLIWRPNNKKIYQLSCNWSIGEQHFIAENYFEYVESRINLDKFKQSVEFEQYNIHDFFYVLLICITGERGDSDIVISSVSNYFH